MKKSFGVFFIIKSWLSMLYYIIISKHFWTNLKFSKCLIKCSFSSVLTIRNFDVGLQSILKIISKIYASINKRSIAFIYKWIYDAYYSLYCEWKKNHCFSFSFCFQQRTINYSQKKLAHFNIPSTKWKQSAINFT